MFSTLSKTEIIIYVRFILSSANAFNLEKVKFFSSGNGLRQHKSKFSIVLGFNMPVLYGRKCSSWKMPCCIILVFLRNMALVFLDQVYSVSVYLQHCLSCIVAAIPCFPEVSFTSTLHNIFLKPPAAFPCHWLLSYITNLSSLASGKSFLAPLAVGQRAYVMVRCPSSVRPSVSSYLRARNCGVRFGLGLVYI